jgi:spore germination protein
MKKIGIIILGVSFGIFLGIIVIINYLMPKNTLSIINPIATKKMVIGFLPYWLLGSANSDYSKYITTLSYFGLRVDQNGNIQKLLSPTQEEPGWNTLRIGKLDQFFSDALKNNISLSLLVVNGNIESINALISDPVIHAKNLVSDLKPLIEKYKFSDINLDIEFTQNASPAARQNFTRFVAAVKKELDGKQTLTVEISPTDVIKSNLIDPTAMNKIADYVVLMAYDYHSTSSFVTGPVAPLKGAGEMSEYDVTAAIEKSLDYISPQKLVLGIPLYGYEWETLGKAPRSAIIPNSGVAASNRRAEELLTTCLSCSLTLDPQADEKYITFPDKALGDFHTIFYPDINSTKAKIDFTNKLKLSGLALWALGYEGNSILNPLEAYKTK